MKKLFLSFLSIVLMLSAYADEGMWIPMLIGKNYEQMKREGLRLTKEDLYNINNSSIKDAVVQFGGGCTAEVISPEGLLLTNHHCGYDAIASLSTIEHDYLDSGYWAHSLSQELPAPGLSVIFLQRMEDVTDKVKQAVGNAKGEEFNKKFEEVRKAIEGPARENGKYVAHVYSFFDGNQYILMVYKRYTDVRFVGTPPKSLGKFGGDTDNWMWPRHTCDFSMFRIYAGKDNEPAPYSPDNVPYKPKKFLPISIKGEDEGDFAMIYGYPGRTNRYEVSYGVDLAVNTVNPAIVKIRDKRLAIMREHMNKDRSVYLKLTSLYARIANYWKYYIGQTEQLKRLHVIDLKKNQEDKFAQWAAKNAPADDNLMNRFAAIYAEYAPYAKHAVYYSECFKASSVARLAAAFEPLDKLLADPAKNKDTIQGYLNLLKIGRRSMMKDFDYATEKDMLNEMTDMYEKDVPSVQLPDIYRKVIDAKKWKEKNKTYADYVMSNTFMLDSNKFNTFCEHPTKKELDNDPAAIYAFSFVRNFSNNYQPKVDSFYTRKMELAKTYVRDLMAMYPDKNFYPDANFTMRITYGKVKGYDPQDGVHYRYYTTLDGLIAKYKPHDDEFDVPQQLLTLYRNKDYGRWADEDGTLHTDFITNDDITGGNSGSPVMNGNGELIGAAFDGNWEAMSGDIAFDKKYKRTIVCDIRFILFVVDKMGHADNLIKEMDIRERKGEDDQN